MKLNKSILSAAIVASLGFAAQLHAQEAATTESTTEATELDRVVVTGIRGALAESLDLKRESNAIVDVITAEDVGKFPATNVAEAMTLIPGVTIDRAFGQGEKVSILGTDPALNRTLLNGQTIASADWYISDQPGRTFNYSLLAPQIVGNVMVYKSPEAHIDEGSIGGDRDRQHPQATGTGRHNGFRPGQLYVQRSHRYWRSAGFAVGRLEEQSR